jgi:1,4-alpha-glucan branching enzyme
VTKGALYKFHIESRRHGYQVDKADPLGLCTRSRRAPPPWYGISTTNGAIASGCATAPAKLAARSAVHLRSSSRFVDARSRGTQSSADLSRDRASSRRLCGRMGFTHVEFLPVMEHPFYGSWGYQTTGYFAPTSRYGTPQDFMYLVDYLHQHGIAVILDWVPSHFPSDAHGLAYFDGTHLYEHAIRGRASIPTGRRYIFNYGRTKCAAF